MVKNYMEEVVDKVLDEVLKREEYRDLCTCDTCIDDVKAKTLNNLTPFYITRKTGEVYGEFFTRGTQENTNIIMEVVKSLEFVSKNNKHNEHR